MWRPYSKAAFRRLVSEYGGPLFLQFGSLLLDRLLGLRRSRQHPAQSRFGGRIKFRGRLEHMTPLEIASLVQQLEEHPIWADRGRAIQDYATLEQRLCSLFARFGKMEPHVAGTVFFRISNTRARIAILDELKRKQLGDQYKAFWKSHTSLVRGVDGRRNEIVHWHVTNGAERVPGALPKIIDVRLEPPNYWAESEAFLTVDDLKAFGRKCSFLSGCLMMFEMLLDGHTASREIFEQEVAYPPPRTHPLFQMSVE